jgi:hypothetical protein
MTRPILNFCGIDFRERLTPFSVFTSLWGYSQGRSCVPRTSAMCVCAPCDGRRYLVRCRLVPKHHHTTPGRCGPNGMAASCCGVLATASIIGAGRPFPDASIPNWPCIGCFYTMQLCGGMLPSRSAVSVCETYALISVYSALKIWRRSYIQLVQVMMRCTRILVSMSSLLCYWCELT